MRSGLNLPRRFAQARRRTFQGKKSFSLPLATTPNEQTSERDTKFDTKQQQPAEDYKPLAHNRRKKQKIDSVAFCASFQSTVLPSKLRIAAYLASFEPLRLSSSFRLPSSSCPAPTTFHGYLTALDRLPNKDFCAAVHQLDACMVETTADTNGLQHTHTQACALLLDACLPRYVHIMNGASSVDAPSVSLQHVPHPGSTFDLFQRLHRVIGMPLATYMNTMTRISSIGNKDVFIRLLVKTWPIRSAQRKFASVMGKLDQKKLVIETELRRWLLCSLLGHNGVDSPHDMPRLSARIRFFRLLDTSTAVFATTARACPVYTQLLDTSWKVFVFAVRDAYIRTIDSSPALRRHMHLYVDYDEFKAQVRGCVAAIRCIFRQELLPQQPVTGRLAPILSRAVTWSIKNAANTSGNSSSSSSTGEGQVKRAFRASPRELAELRAVNARLDACIRPFHQRILDAGHVSPLFTFLTTVHKQMGQIPPNAGLTGLPVIQEVKRRNARKNKARDSAALATAAAAGASDMALDDTDHVISSHSMDLMAAIDPVALAAELVLELEREQGAAAIAGEAGAGGEARGDETVAEGKCVYTGITVSHCRILDRLLQRLDLQQMSSDQVLTDIAPRMPLLLQGNPESPWCVSRQGVRALLELRNHWYTMHTTKEERHDALWDFAVSFPYTYAAVQTLEALRLRQASIRRMPLDFYVTHFQRQALTERYGCSLHDLPPLPCHLWLCSSCHMIWSPVRTQTDCGAKAVYGLNGAIVDSDTDLPWCYWHKQIMHTACQAQPLSALDGLGFKFFVGHTQLLICPQEACGQWMVYDPRFCHPRPNERGPACSSCTIKLLTDQLKHTRDTHPLGPGRSFKCAVCDKKTGTAANTFIYGHNFMLCARHHSKSQAEFVNDHLEQHGIDCTVDDLLDARITQLCREAVVDFRAMVLGKSTKGGTKGRENVEWVFGARWKQKNAAILRMIKANANAKKVRR